MSVEFENKVKNILNDIGEMLISKNRKYGDSALNPIRIFSRSDKLEQIRVRMDDKLKRIMNEQTDEDEDVYRDLIGYLVIYLIALEEEDTKKETKKSIPNLELTDTVK